MLKGKREADFLKIAENCQKLLTKSQNNCIRLKSLKCKHTFLGLLEQPIGKCFCNILRVNITSMVCVLSWKTAEMSIYRLLIRFVRLPTPAHLPPISEEKGKGRK